MKKNFETPELNILRFDMQEPITAEEGLSIGGGLIGDEGVEEW